MKTKKRFTLDGVMSWIPCLSREEVGAYFGGRKYMTVATLMETDLSTENKLWCLLRPEVIPEKTLHTLSCDFADRALLREREAGREPDPRSWRAVAVKRLWIDGQATDDELRAARAAAWEAAGEAAGEAARAAAREAAWVAAREAAWEAAWEAALAAARAAWEAALAAARAAAREAEREWQLARALAGHTENIGH